MPPFKVTSKFRPSRDQERAIDELASGVAQKLKYQTLLGVTGSGKTFTMAKVIERSQKRALVLTHNKTLAAQLYREFSEFFPDNAVEYFVSYYDYYQPEAYVVSQDLYIEKDASINDEIDRLRLKATSSILDRSDVIVVSSVSCIYGLGSPESYEAMQIALHVGDVVNRDDILRELVAIHYERNDISFMRGTFRARGDVIEVFPAYLKNALRIELFGDEVERISVIDPLTGRTLSDEKLAYIYPAKHYVSPPDEMRRTVEMIGEELEERLAALRAANRLLEAQRLESRTRYDMEMLLSMGYCNGIENYSRIISRRNPGEPPGCLLDYFKGDYMMFIDESHVTIPQVRGMFEGDRSRKQNLVEFGFRLPSALDNRPLHFEEFERIINQAVFVSATPGDWELRESGKVVEQVVRPTGLLDPLIEVRSAKNQVDDLIGEVNARVARNERVLVTTLTKKMSEDLTDYFVEAGIRAKYLHSEIETIERVEIIRDLRKGVFDCLVGINLLREGLDLPEVSLVAILDADKEGFLRSYRPLVQTAGRAARNINGRVIMYADRMTDSMRLAISETERRRKIQNAYNIEHGITPRSIEKEILDILEREYHTDDTYADYVADYRNKYRSGNLEQLESLIKEMRGAMLAAAENLEFEKAAVLRDEMLDCEKKIELLKKAGK